jgi:hypothetical protein
MSILSLRYQYGIILSSKLNTRWRHIMVYNFVYRILSEFLINRRYLGVEYASNFKSTIWRSNARWLILKNVGMLIVHKCWQLIL